MNETITKHKKFLSDNKIQDGLLKDFISRGLWRPCFLCIDEAIDQREKEIAALGMLRDEISVEVAKNGKINTCVNEEKP